MADQNVPVVDPRNPVVRAQLEGQIAGLDDRQTNELIFDLDKWARTVHNGRKSEGVLNGQYELCVFEAHDPFNWIVGAYDTQSEQFVPAAFLPDEEQPSLDEIARLCANALAETVVTLETLET